MIFRVLTVLPFLFLFYPHAAHAVPDWCRPDGPPRVHVGLQAPNPVGDYNKSVKELEENQNIDTVSPYGAQAKTHVGGLTEGNIEVRQKLQVGGKRKGAESCVWLDDLKVVVRLEQTVYVAKEYRPGSCMYNSIWEHEHKHVRVDREILNDYRPQYEAAIYRFLWVNPVVGPFDVSGEKERQESLLAQLKQVIDGVTSQMELERKARQQAVDNLEEYQRVSDICRGRS